MSVWLLRTSGSGIVLQQISEEAWRVVFAIWEIQSTSLPLVVKLKSSALVSSLTREHVFRVLSAAEALFRRTRLVVPLDPALLVRGVLTQAQRCAYIMTMTDPRAVSRS